MTSQDILTLSIIVAQCLTALCVVKAIVTISHMKSYGEGIDVCRWMLLAQPFYIYTCIACKEYGMIGLSFIIVVMCREGFGRKGN